MKSKFLKVVLGFAAVVLLLFIGGFSVGSVGLVPDYATVYVDEVAGIFYSPLSLTQEMATELNLKHTTFGVAKGLGYIMYEEDKQNGYFQEKGRSLSGKLLENIGILPKLKPRCNLDGSWNY